MAKSTTEIRQSDQVSAKPIGGPMGTIPPESRTNSVPPNSASEQAPPSANVAEPVLHEPSAEENPKTLPAPRNWSIPDDVRNATKALVGVGWDRQSLEACGIAELQSRLNETESEIEGLLESLEARNGRIFGIWRNRLSSIFEALTLSHVMAENDGRSVYSIWVRKQAELNWLQNKNRTALENWRLAESQFASAYVEHLLTIARTETTCPLCAVELNLAERMFVHDRLQNVTVHEIVCEGAYRRSQAPHALSRPPEAHYFDEIRQLRAQIDALAARRGIDCRCAEAILHTYIPVSLIRPQDIWTNVTRSDAISLLLACCSRRAAQVDFETNTMRDRPKTA